MHKSDEVNKFPKFSRIHNKYYNLAEFEQFHPGGRNALSMAYGRDGTGLFESYHTLSSRDKLIKMIEKYEVTDPARLEQYERLLAKEDKENSNHFDWVASKEDPFYVETKALLMDYFKGEMQRRKCTLKEAMKAPPARWAEIFVMFVMTAISGYYWLLGEYWALLAWPVCVWIYGVNTFHDGSHFALSTLPWVNDFFLFSYYIVCNGLLWMHQHIVGHHIYPNVSGRDPDLYHAPKYVRHDTNIKWRPAHGWQFPLGFVWVTSVATWVGLVYISAFKTLQTYAYNKVVSVYLFNFAQFRWGQYIYLVAYTFLVFVLPFLTMDFWKATYWGAVTASIYSWEFMMVTQVGHLVDDLVIEDNDQVNPLWYRHQVETSCSFSKDSYLMYQLTGGLNYQSCHHLFPGINHHHWRFLHEPVFEIAKKNGVKANYLEGFWAATFGHFRHLIMKGKKSVE